MTEKTHYDQIDVIFSAIWKKFDQWPKNSSVSAKLIVVFKEREWEVL